MSDVRHPEVTVKLINEDGNAFAILARCRRAMKDAGVDKQEIESFLAAATIGGYDHLLATVQQWMNVE